MNVLRNDEHSRKQVAKRNEQRATRGAPAGSGLSKQTGEQSRRRTGAAPTEKVPTENLVDGGPKACVCMYTCFEAAGNLPLQVVMPWEANPVDSPGRCGSFTAHLSRSLEWVPTKPVLERHRRKTLGRTKATGKVTGIRNGNRSYSA